MADSISVNLTADATAAVSNIEGLSASIAELAGRFDELKSKLEVASQDVDSVTARYGGLGSAAEKTSADIEVMNAAINSQVISTAKAQAALVAYQAEVAKGGALAAAVAAREAEVGAGAVAHRTLGQSIMASLIPGGAGPPRGEGPLVPSKREILSARRSYSAFANDLPTQASLDDVARNAKIAEAEERAQAAITRRPRIAEEPAGVTTAQLATAQRGLEELRKPIDVPLLTPNLTGVTRAIDQVREQTERAAHGVTTALDAAFTTPASLRTLTREIQSAIPKPEAVPFSDALSRARGTTTVEGSATLGLAGQVAGVEPALAQTRGGEGAMAEVAAATQAAQARKALTQGLIQDGATQTAQEARYRAERVQGLEEEQRLAQEAATLKKEVYDKASQAESIYTAQEKRYRAEREAGLKEETQLGQEAAVLKKSVQENLARDAATARAAEIKAQGDLARAQRISQVAQRGIPSSEKVGLTEDQLNVLGLQHFMAASAQTRAEIVRLAETSATAAQAGRAAGAGIASGFGSGVASARNSLSGLGAELRHGVAEIDEYARGAHGAMASSAVAFARDSGLLGQAISSITPAGAAAAGGFAILAAGVLNAIRTMVDFSQATTGTINSLTILGQASQFSSDQITGWQRNLIRNFGEGISSSKQMLMALNDLPPAASHLRPAIAQLGEAFGTLRNVGSVKGTEEIAKIFKGGAASALKYAEEVRAVSPAVAEHIEVLIHAGHEEEALDEITAALGRQFGEAGSEIAKAENALYRMLGTTKDSYDPFAFLAAGIIGVRKAFGGFRADASNAPAPLSQVQRIGQRTTVQALPEENKRDLLNQKIKDEEDYQADLERQLKNVRTGANEVRTSNPKDLTGGGASVQFETSTALPGPETEARVKSLEEALKKAREGAEETRLELAKIHTPMEADQFNVERQVIAQRRLVAERQNDQATLVALAKQEGDLEVQYAHGTEQAKAAAATRTMTAEMAQQQDAIAAELARYRASAMASHRGADERVADVKNEMQLLTKYHEENTERYRALQVQLVTAQRQYNDAIFQEYKQEQLEEIAVANVTAEQKIAAYERIKQKARETDQLPKTITQLDRTENRDLSRDQEKYVHEEMRLADQVTEIDRASVRMRVAQLEQLASARRGDNFAALSEEATLMAQYAAQEEQTYQGIADQAEASAQDRINALEKVAKVAAETAEREFELAKKVTDEQRKRADEASKFLVQTFDKAGTAVEGLIDAIVTRSKAPQQAFRDFAIGLTKDVLHGAEDLGSQLLAKGVGNLTGTEVKPGEGVGAVLGHTVGRLLGLGDKPDAQKGVEEAIRVGNAEREKATHVLSEIRALLQKEREKVDAGRAQIQQNLQNRPMTGGGNGLPPDVTRPATGQYADQINAAAQKYDVPPPILYNLLGAESGFDPHAAGPPVASRGGAKARGMGQFMPEEAKEYGVDVDDAGSSIQGAAHYLSVLHRRTGTWSGALGAYSGQGPGLAGYAAEKNPYGPALVQNARAADSGSTVATYPIVPVDVSSIGGVKPATMAQGALPIAPANPTQPPVVARPEVAQTRGLAGTQSGPAVERTADGHVRVATDPQADAPRVVQVPPSPTVTGAGTSASVQGTHDQPTTGNLQASSDKAASSIQRLGDAAATVAAQLARIGPGSAMADTGGTLPPTAPGGEVHHSGGVVGAGGYARGGLASNERSVRGLVGERVLNLPETAAYHQAFGADGILGFAQGGVAGLNAKEVAALTQALSAAGNAYAKQEKNAILKKIFPFGVTGTLLAAGGALFGGIAGSAFLGSLLGSKVGGGTSSDLPKEDPPHFAEGGVTEPFQDYWQRNVGDNAIAQAMLARIGQGEAGRYDALYGNRSFSDYGADYSAFPHWPGVRTTRGWTHSAGLYQDQPRTWAREQTRLNLPDMSPAAQDVGNYDLALRTYYRNTGGRDLEDDFRRGSVDLGALGSEWESLKGARPVASSALAGKTPPPKPPFPAPSFPVDREELMTAMPAVGVERSELTSPNVTDTFSSSFGLAAMAGVPQFADVGVAHFDEGGEAPSTSNVVRFPQEDPGALTRVWRSFWGPTQREADLQAQSKQMKMREITGKPLNLESYGEKVTPLFKPAIETAQPAAAVEPEIEYEPESYLRAREKQVRLQNLQPLGENVVRVPRVQRQDSVTGEIRPSITSTPGGARILPFTGETGGLGTGGGIGKGLLPGGLPRKPGTEDELSYLVPTASQVLASGGIASFAQGGVAGFAAGGTTGGGTDTVPAWLTPGERVLTLDETAVYHETFPRGILGQQKFAQGGVAGYASGGTIAQTQQVAGGSHGPLTTDARPFDLAYLTANSQHFNKWKAILVILAELAAGVGLVTGFGALFGNKDPSTDAGLARKAIESPTVAKGSANDRATAIPSSSSLLSGLTDAQISGLPDAVSGLGSPVTTPLPNSSPAISGLTDAQISGLPDAVSGLADPTGKAEGGIAGFQEGGTAESWLGTAWGIATGARPMFHDAWTPHQLEMQQNVAQQLRDVSYVMAPPITAYGGISAVVSKGQDLIDSFTASTLSQDKVDTFAKSAKESREEISQAIQAVQPGIRIPYLPPDPLMLPGPGGTGGAPDQLRLPDQLKLPAPDVPALPSKFNELWPEYKIDVPTDEQPGFFSKLKDQLQNLARDETGALSLDGKRVTSYTEDQLAEWAQRTKEQYEVQRVKVQDEYKNSFTLPQEKPLADLPDAVRAPTAEPFTFPSLPLEPLPRIDVEAPTLQAKRVTDQADAARNYLNLAATQEKFKLELAPPVLAPPETLTALQTNTLTKIATATSTDNIADQLNQQELERLTGTQVQVGPQIQVGVQSTAALPGGASISTGGTPLSNPLTTFGIPQRVIVGEPGLAFQSPIIEMDTSNGRQQYFVTSDQLVSMLNDFKQGGPPTSIEAVSKYMMQRPDLFTVPYGGAVSRAGASYPSPKGQWFADYGRGWEPTGVPAGLGVRGNYIAAVATGSASRFVSGPLDSPLGDTSIEHFRLDASWQGGIVNSEMDIGHLAGGQVIKAQDLLHNQTLKDAYDRWEADPGNRQRASTTGENPVFDKATSDAVLAEQTRIQNLPVPDVATTVAPSVAPSVEAAVSQIAQAPAIDFGATQVTTLLPTDSSLLNAPTGYQEGGIVNEPSPLYNTSGGGVTGIEQPVLASSPTKAYWDRYTTGVVQQVKGGQLSFDQARADLIRATGASPTDIDRALAAGAASNGATIDTLRAAYPGIGDLFKPKPADGTLSFDEMRTDLIRTRNASGAEVDQPLAAAATARGTTVDALRAKFPGEPGFFGRIANLFGGNTQTKVSPLDRFTYLAKAQPSTGDTVRSDSGNVTGSTFYPNAGIRTLTAADSPDLRAPNAFPKGYATATVNGKTKDYADLTPAEYRRVSAPDDRAAAREYANFQQYQGVGVGVPDLFNGDGPGAGQLPQGSLSGFYRGGSAGLATGGVGTTDTVPAMLTPGERVLTTAETSVYHQTFPRGILGHQKFAQGGIVGAAGFADGGTAGPSSSNSDVSDEHSLVESFGAVSHNLTSFTQNMKGLNDTLGALGNTSKSTTSSLTSTVNTLSSAFSGVSSLVSGLGSLFGGGGGGGGSAGIGSIFGAVGSVFKGITGIAGLLALEGGGVIPSASGGLLLHPQESTLPAGVGQGIRHMASTGMASAFAYGSLVSASGGAQVRDGKGGQLAILHPGEMVLPSRETGMVLGSIASGVSATSAAGGYIPAAIGSGAGAMVDPAVALFHSGAYDANPSAPASGSNGGDTHIHVNAIDTRSGAQFLMSNADHVAKAVYRARRNNNPRAGNW